MNSCSGYFFKHSHLLTLLLHEFSEMSVLTLSFPGSRGWILRIQEDQQINVSKLFNGQHTTINEISNETLDISF